MKIVLAEKAGFCFGVKRAMSIVEKTIEKYKDSGKPIYTLGDIIHNTQVVEKLKERGVLSIEDPENHTPGYLIIRSHGVSPDVIKKVKDLGYEVIDATCPFVKKVQNYAEREFKKGRYIILIGENNHPEVKGISGYIKGDFTIIESESDISKLPKDKDLPVTVVSQTTQSFEFFNRVVKELKNMYNNIQYYDTICDATHLRQEESVAIAKNVDVMIVIGGYKSANTKRLALLCREAGAEVYHIETANEINKDWFIGIDSVGITAGASTPNWIIEDVVKKIHSIL